MENNKRRQISAKKFVIAAVSFALLAALIVFIIALFYSATDINIDAFTISALGIVIFAILLVLYVSVKSLGKVNTGMVIMTYSTLFITVFASITLLHFKLYLALPLAFCPLMLSVNYDREVAFATHIATVVVVAVCEVLFAFFAGDTKFDALSVQITELVVQTLLGISIIYTIKPYANRFRVLAVAIVNVVVFGVVAFIAAAAVGGKPNLWDMFAAAGYTIAGGAVGVLLFFCLTPVYERVFNLKTGLRLMELCSYNQPLLKELAEKASGTFNHCLTVANIAERCAYAIGENQNLAKAAALYHDVGKMENPEYFTENQVDGYNPHDDLIPEASVKMITRHTDAGAKLLEAKGFPAEIIAVAAEHHGDSAVGYFYNKAQNITEGTLEKEGYRYEGPKPSSKISGIVMIADIAEAATRSVRPSNREELVNLIDRLIADKFKENQFDNCPLTMQEITIIKRTVADTLMGVYHERISYNNAK